jgi:hypothetical protein
VLVFQNANHATAFIISFSIQKTHEKNIIQPHIWTSGDEDSTKLKVTCEVHFPRYCQMEDLLFSLQLYFPSFLLIKETLQDIPLLVWELNIFIVKNFLKTSVCFSFKDVIIFSYADVKSLQPYLLSNYSSITSSTALVSSSRCKLLVLPPL